MGGRVGGTTSNSVPEKCPIGHFTVVYVVAKPLIEDELRLVLVISCYL